MCQSLSACLQSFSDDDHRHHQIIITVTKLQGGNEAGDTDAEIERIKSEIELEQKNKQTLGDGRMIILMKLLIMITHEQIESNDEDKDEGAMMMMIDNGSQNGQTWSWKRV